MFKIWCDDSYAWFMINYKPNLQIVTSLDVLKFWGQLYKCYAFFPISLSAILHIILKYWNLLSYVELRIFGVIDIL